MTWNVGDYIDRAISAFGFDRILYESNWFVNDAMGDPYDKTAMLLYDGCKRAGATPKDLRMVFHDNACKVQLGDFISWDQKQTRIMGRKTHCKDIKVWIGWNLDPKRTSIEKGFVCRHEKWMILDDSDLRYQL